MSVELPGALTALEVTKKLQDNLQDELNNFADEVCTQILYRLNMLTMECCTCCHLGSSADH